MSLLVAEAVFGEVELSLFVASTVYGEIWNDSRGASIQNAHGKRERVISCAAGCGLTVSWSERSRNGLGSVAHCK